MSEVFVDAYYDQQADILSLVFGDAVPARFERAGAVSIALDALGRVVEFEIASASKHAPLSLLGQAPRADQDTKPLAELAAIVGLSVESLRKACQHGKLGAFKVGKTWFSSEVQVRAWRATAKPVGRPVRIA